MAPVCLLQRVHLIGRALTVSLGIINAGRVAVELFARADPLIPTGAVVLIPYEVSLWVHMWYTGGAGKPPLCLVVCTFVQNQATGLVLSL